MQIGLASMCCKRFRWQFLYSGSYLARKTDEKSIFFLGHPIVRHVCTLLPFFLETNLVATSYLIQCDLASPMIKHPP